jgi:hypothetical protein
MGLNILFHAAAAYSWMTYCRSGSHHDSHSQFSKWLKLLRHGTTGRHSAFRALGSFHLQTTIYKVIKQANTNLCTCVYNSNPSVILCIPSKLAHFFIHINSNKKEYLTKYTCIAEYNLLTEYPTCQFLTYVREYILQTLQIA